jgi:DNA-directed RNA polymerase specialized sigma24 family protein
VAGDEDQRERRFCRLYEANFRPVQAYAVNRLARSDDVADVVAEVFMVAWRRLADVPPPPHDRFWLYGTARRVIAKRYRSGSRWHNLLGRLAADRRREDAVFSFVASLGGSISAEHGIGALKAPWLPLARTDAERALFARIRSALDPSATLNPNVLPR